MIKVLSYQEVNQERSIRFFEDAAKGSEPAAENMRDLPRLIEERFTIDGCFQILMDGDDIIGCGGAYLSDFSQDVALLGCRSWLIPRVRGKSHVRDLLLPAHRSWAISRGAKQVAISFNYYNKSLRALFTRKLMPRSQRTSEMLFFNNLNELDFPVMIKNTPQWVLYEELGECSFDWHSIAAPDSQQT